MFIIGCIIVFTIENTTGVDDTILQSDSGTRKIYFIEYVCSMFGNRYHNSVYNYS